MIAVIGCGNPTRQDDGLGPEVIRILKTRGLEGPVVRLLDAGTDGMSVMFAARGATTLVIVDAARSGSQPGAVFEVPGAELERPYTPGLTLHDFRWDAALHAGRQIFRKAFPADVKVFLVEAQALDFGVGLSEPVARAAGTVVARIEALLRARAGPQGPAETWRVTIRRGGLYLDRALCERCFAGLETVVLIRRDDDLLVLPVRHAAAGGYLLKRRNGAGDRVVHAPDFFRAQGLADQTELNLDAVWEPDQAALVATRAFEN